MLVKGTFVHTPELGKLEILQDHLIEVNDEGTITHFSPATSRRSQALIEQNSSDDGQNVSYVELPRGTFLLPTFCDLHLHAPQFLYQGTGLDRPLMQWLDAYALKAEARLDEDPRLAKRVYDRLASRLRENGTGTVVLFGTIKCETNIILAQSMLRAGIRSFIGKVSMDIDITPVDSPTHGTYIEPSTASSLANAKQFINDIEEMLQLKESSGSTEQITKERKYAKSLIQPVLTPRFVPTCTDELLKGLGGLAFERNVWIQTHVHEARDEVEWVKHERGIEGLEVLKRNNLLTSRTILAHCTYLPLDEEYGGHRTGSSNSGGNRGSPSAGPASPISPTSNSNARSLTSLPPTAHTSTSPHDSLSLLASRLVTMAHCPLSNFYFSGGRAFPLREALSTGCRVGYGSDIAGGYSADIMNAMRTGVLTGRGREGGRQEAARENGYELIDDDSTHVTGCNQETKSLAVDWKESVYVATRGGAIALGLKGMFVVGGSFDAQEIKLFDPIVKRGIGSLDFFDAEEDAVGTLNVQSGDAYNQDSKFVLNDDAVEKWWCVGDFRNRGRMWVLGREI